MGDFKGSLPLFLCPCKPRPRVSHSRPATCDPRTATRYARRDMPWFCAVSTAVHQAINTWGTVHQAVYTWGTSKLRSGRLHTATAVKRRSERAPTIPFGNALVLLYDKISSQGPVENPTQKTKEAKIIIRERRSRYM